MASPRRLPAAVARGSVALAAALICFGGRRLRILGLVVALPAVLLVLEVAVLLPNRPPRGIDHDHRGAPHPGGDSRGGTALP